MSSSNRIAREKSARRRDSRRVTAGSRSARRRQNVRSFERLRLKTLASAGGTAGTVTSWPSTPAIRSHRFGAIPRQPGSSATSTGRCRPSSKTPPRPSRWRDPRTPRRARPALRRRCCRLRSPGRFPGSPPASFDSAGGPVRPGGAAPRRTSDHARSRALAPGRECRGARIRAAAPSGVLVEPKGLSVTCHYRADPSLEAQVTALAQEVVAATALVARAGRKSVALLPPTHADKGMVPGNGPRTCTLPAISVTISAMCRPSAPSTIWPPGGSPRHGSRCAAMRRPGNCCKLRT